MSNSQQILELKLIKKKNFKKPQQDIWNSNFCMHSALLPRAPKTETETVWIPSHEHSPSPARRVWSNLLILQFDTVKPWVIQYSAWILMTSVSEPSLFPRRMVVMSSHTLWHQVKGGSERRQRQSADWERALLLLPREASLFNTFHKQGGKGARTPEIPKPTVSTWEPWTLAYPLWCLHHDFNITPLGDKNGTSR